MEFRCHNCGERIVIHPSQVGREVECPACGVTMIHGQHASPDHTGGPPPPDRGVPRPTQKTLRRIFEPIPRPVIYAAGIVLTLVILAPFWIYLLQDGFSRRPILLSEDAASLPAAPRMENHVPATPALEKTRPTPGEPGQFRGLRLNASREDVQRHYNLRLVNTRGMVPEIFEIPRDATLQQATLQFYNSVLKEYSVTLTERRISPDVLTQELTDELGEPAEMKDRPRTGDSAELPAALPGALDVAKSAGELERRLSNYHYRRDLKWSDEETVVEATIYYTSLDRDKCDAFLTLHASAVRWLEASRPHIGSLTTLPVEPPATPAEPAEPEQPKRLFP